MNARKWRKKPSEELIKLMEESVDLKLYLIHERGPLSLTFQDEQNKKYEIKSDIIFMVGSSSIKLEYLLPQKNEKEETDQIKNTEKKEEKNEMTKDAEKK